MVITVIDTMPAIRRIVKAFDYTLWSAVNQSAILTDAGVNISLGSGIRVLGITLEKSVGLDAGALKLGTSSVSAHRETIGSGAEVDAINPGTVALAAWRTSTDGTTLGGLNNLTKVSPRFIYARFEGAALPTQGQFTLYIDLYDTPRTTL